jgi:zinc and cadmium transporter
VHFIDYILLFGLAFLSGILYLFIKPQANILKLVLTFSGAYLFCLTAIHLLPELYSDGNPLKTGIFIVVGFVLQIILEVFSEGIEHGHIHVHKHEHSHNHFPWLMMLGLSIHSFMEGMPLSCQFQGILHLKINPLLAGILLHNIPIAYSLMSMLMQSGIKKMQALFFLILFSLMAPLGSAFSNLLQLVFVNNLSEYYNIIMAVVVGIFLHISTTILFESSNNHRFNIIKIATVLGGAATAVLLEYI